jgi:glutathione S-transferase
MKGAMPNLKLTYFDMHAGRGETARIALFIGKVPYDDARVPFAQFPALKPSLPFGAIPVLEVDGQVLAQSNGINRYVGKLTGLYPEDALEAAFCDEAMDAVEELSAKIAPSFAIQDPEEKKRARIALADGPISQAFVAIEKRLAARGGEWFADRRLTVADIKIFLALRHLKSGQLDFVPTDLAERVAPGLAAHFERVKAHADVQAYYQWRGVAP